MDKIALTNKLSEIIFGKTRQAVLSLLYGHADESFYLRQIVRVAGGGMGAVQRQIIRWWMRGWLREVIKAGRFIIRPTPDRLYLEN